MALPRDLAGLRYSGIADRTAVSVTAAHAAYEFHARLLEHERAYRRA